MRTASCACGALSVACEGEPVRISVCHCSNCQRRTGSAFGAMAAFPGDQVRIEGESGLYARETDSGATARFRFCTTCGSTVWWDHSARPELVCVALGAFADAAFPAPDREVFGEKAHAWARLGLPIQE